MFSFLSHTASHSDEENEKLSNEKENRDSYIASVKLSQVIE